MPAISLLILAVLSQPASAPSVKSREDFARIISALHAPIQDFSMVYEGDSRYVGPGNLKPDDVGDDPVVLRYQSAYWYRNDGAVLLDVYKRRTQPEISLHHARHAVLRGKMEILETTPAEAAESPPIHTFPGSSATMLAPSSAQDFVYLWYFPKTTASNSNVFELLGSEKIEGEECLKIHIDNSPRYQGPSKRSYMMWIDLRRGGHVLKADTLVNSKPMESLHSVTLKQFRISGNAEIWFPVQAIVDSYMLGGKPRDVPTFRRTYSVVSGSLKFNQKLTDQVFSLKREARIPPALAASSLRREFLAARPAPPPPRKKQPDLAAVEKELEARLSESKRESNLIEAPSAARETISSTTISQIVFLIVGAATLGFAAVWIRRNS